MDCCRPSVVLILCACLLGGVLSASDWSYADPYGPENWHINYELCGHASQSPINIYEGDVKNEGYSNFQPVNYNRASGVTWTMLNNGHAAQVDVTGSTNIEMSGGGLPGTSYRVAQFHWHWGSHSGQGSEHLLSTHEYPMELHIVHYNLKYAEPAAAIPEADGLAVLGFMYEITDEDNPNYANLVQKLQDIPNDGDSTSVTAIPIDDLLPGELSTLTNFYRYSGSLTTPACYESVTWTVFKDTIKISAEQLAAFRTLMFTDGSPMVDNYRPPQPRNDRVVSSSFTPDITWGYVSNGVEDWANYYETCGGQSQSPIDLPTTGSEYDANIPAINYVNYDKASGFQMELYNNGHNVQVSLLGSHGIAVNGGDYPDTYNAAQFHLHWGSRSMRGSEHTRDGVEYPAELHIVHWRDSFGDINAAVTEPEGLAVLGFFLELSENDNPALQTLIDHLQYVEVYGSKFAIDQLFSLNSILPTERDGFYRYSGSLTTPGCFESVIWTVFDATIPISERQLEAFRRLKSDEVLNGMSVNLVDNYRPVQPLNGRVIKRNFQVSSPFWTYEGNYGINHWYEAYPVCEDTPTSRQSPINIVSREAQYTSDLGSFRFSGYDDPVTLKMSNDGHTVKANIVSGDLRISGGGLSDTYKATQFHFHWGPDSMHGSEHTLDNQEYGLELHIVHYGAGYSDIASAADKANGLAVLGFFFEVISEDNPLLTPIIEKLADVRQPDAEIQFTMNEMSALLPPGLDNYYRYSGSLTTPPCYESVVWTVFQSKILISADQLAQFRELLSIDVDQATGNYKPIMSNYRPPQPLHGRVVYASFKMDPNSASGVKAGLFVSVIALLFSLIARAL